MSLWRLRVRWVCGRFALTTSQPRGTVSSGSCIRPSASRSRRKPRPMTARRGGSCSCPTMCLTLLILPGAWSRMKDQDILNGLTRILCDLLSDDSIVLTMQTKRNEVANWDSFAYVSFIVAVAIEFSLKFRVAEIESFQDVGAIVRRISAILPTR